MPALLRKLSSRLSRTDKDRGQKRPGGNNTLEKVDEHNSKPADTKGPTRPEQVVKNDFSQALAKTKDVRRTSSHKSPVGHGSSSSNSDSDNDEALATRSQVEMVFAQHASLIHASKEPLPEQVGHGSYAHQDESGGFWSDIRSLGLKDLKTVRNIIADKASG